MIVSGSAGIISKSLKIAAIRGLMVFEIFWRTGFALTIWSQFFQQNLSRLGKPYKQVNFTLKLFEIITVIAKLTFFISCTWIIYINTYFQTNYKQFNQLTLTETQHNQIIIIKVSLPVPNFRVGINCKLEYSDIVLDDDVSKLKK